MTLLIDELFPRKAVCNAIVKVGGEVTRQGEMWGERHDHRHTPSDWFMILERQMTHVREAINGHRSVSHELEQVAAVAVSWMAALEERGER